MFDRRGPRVARRGGPWANKWQAETRRRQRIWWAWWAWGTDCAFLAVQCCADATHVWQCWRASSVVFVDGHSLSVVSTEYVFGLPTRRSFWVVTSLSSFGVFFCSVWPDLGPTPLQTRTSLRRPHFLTKTCQKSCHSSSFLLSFSWLPASTRRMRKRRKTTAKTTQGFLLRCDDTRSDRAGMRWGPPSFACPTRQLVRDNYTRTQHCGKMPDGSGTRQNKK